MIKESSEHWIRPPHHCRACVAGVAAMTYAPSETALAFSFNADPDEKESIYSIARGVLGLTEYRPKSAAPVGVRWIE